MGQQVSVETFTSSSDQNGNKYWASFDPYPFKVGSRKLVYMGMLNGNGPLNGQKCVVKTLRRGAMNKKDWMLETKRAQVTRDMANGYNRTTSQHEWKISVSCPIMAELDTLSDCMCINDIIGKPKKNFKETDFVSMELYIRGSFEVFEYGWVSPEDLLVPEAFSHFTWCHSEGSILVSNLQGVKNSRGYHFTGPVIHSEEKSYGCSDLGHEGIKGFFKLHECNRVCRNWPRLGDGVDLRGWGEFMCADDTFPSAPPLPPPPPYEEENDIMMPSMRQSRGQVTNRMAPWQQQDEQSMLPRDQEVTRMALCQQHGGQNMFPRDQEVTPMIPWQQNRGQSMLLDWREEIMNQNMFYEMNPGVNNGYQNNVFGMQMMWYVKQMSSAFYPPPPPYCTCAPRRNEIVHNHNNHDNEELDYYSDSSDKQFLLPPPPYSEESVAPEMDSVTYL